MMHVKDYYNDCVIMGVFNHFKQGYHIRDEFLTVEEQDELDDLLRLRQNVLDVFYTTSNIKNVYKSEKDFKKVVENIKNQHIELIDESIIGILVET